MMKKTIYLFTAFLLLCTVVFAADGTPSDNSYHWGNNQDEAKGNWMFLNDAIDQKDYRSALKPLYWLLNNSHDLNVALYVQGTKVLEENVKLEKNAAHQLVLEDSTLWMYDERVKLYGDEANVINRKGRVAWKYLHDRKGNEDDLYSLYKNIYEQNQSEMLIQNSTYYYRTAIAVYRQNKIEKTEVLTLYTQMMSFLDEKAIANPKSIISIEKNRARINREFDKYVSLDCAEIETYYGTKYSAHPTIDEAKKINNLLVNKHCVSSDLFMQTNEFILINEPSANRYKVTAKIYLSKGDLEKSYDYFTKSIELETDNKLNAELYMEIAKIDNKNHQFNKARTNALTSVSLGGDQKTAYEFIGDMYFVSGNVCATDDVLQNKAMYIAAYNMYSKAGSTSKMNMAKQQFPTIEEIFVRNKKEGDQINIGCWINETVSLQQR